MCKIQPLVRNPKTPPPHVTSGRLLHLPRPSGRLLHTRHPGGGPRLLHGKLHERALAPRVPPDGLVRVRLLLMQAHADVHQLPSAAIYASDRQDGDTPQAIKKILAQHSLTRDSTTTLHGRLNVHVPLARGITTPTRPRRGITTPARTPTQPKEGHVAQWQPYKWETISALRSTSKTASFEPPSTSCKPSPNMLLRYSAAQRASPVGYPRDS
jgi:hypothetical protein